MTDIFSDGVKFCDAARGGGGSGLDCDCRRWLGCRDCPVRGKLGQLPSASDPLLSVLLGIQ